MVESITGINPIVLGGTPNPNAPVGTTQMAVSAVSSVIKPLVDGYLSVKLGMAKNICRLIHICVHAYPYSRKQYSNVVGEFDMQVLMSADRDSTEYAIRMDVRPGDLEKQKMIEIIQQASAVDRDGNTNGLTGMEGLILIRRLEAGIPMAQVEMEFEMRRRRNIREAQQRASQNAQQQSQLTMQSAQQAAMLADQQAQKQFERDLALIQEKNKGLLANTALQEGARHEKETNVQNIKADAEKYGKQLDYEKQRNSDNIKSQTQKDVEAMKLASVDAEVDDD